MSGSERTKRDVHFRRENPQGQLFLTHFQGEQSHRLLFANGHVFRNVQGQTGLTHARPAGDDHEIPGIQPTGDVIEVHIAGRDADKAPVRPLLQVSKGVVKDLAS